MLKKILIVDQTETNRGILTDMLEDNYDVIAASDRFEALEIIQKNSVSAVILGIEDGVLEMIKTMRNDALLCDIPVLVSAGVYGEKSKVHALAIGAHGFITRPYNTYRIQQFIKNICYNDMCSEELADITC